MPLTEKNPLSSNAIKLIAIAAMTVDHIAWAVFPGYPKEFLPLLMHLIGRITCPIMCYCIAEGYHYTRNIRKYTARLFVFALISHFCYIYFSHDSSTGAPLSRSTTAARSTRRALCGRLRGVL